MTDRELLEALELINRESFITADYEGLLKQAITALRDRLAQREREPDGKVVAATGSLNDVAMIQWTGSYRPQIGDLIYASPPAPLTYAEGSEDQVSRAVPH